MTERRRCRWERARRTRGKPIFPSTTASGLIAFAVVFVADVTEMVDVVEDVRDLLENKFILKGEVGVETDNNSRVIPEHFLPARQTNSDSGKRKTWLD